jgi:APA family basic amino acid/polyamine antiporter
MAGKYSLTASTSVVIANMIGTGVFTSLGFQLLGIHDFATIVLLWIVGGIIALCGAFAYSELGAAMPQSGGEYNFLTKIFHPSLGFLSGWVSATIGFAAPIALSAMTLGKYFGTVFPALNPMVVGLVVILGATIIHSLSHSVGGSFQTLFTVLKVLLIIVFIFCGFFFGGIEHPSFAATGETWKNMLGSPFAISLVYVSFAYSGWNASSYIAGEVDEPKKNIPLSILAGTIVVGALYVLLNIIFLHTAPVNELIVDTKTFAPREVAFISASHIFNIGVGKVFSVVISLFLVSTISSMIIAGPRVIHSIAQSFPFFKIFDRTNKYGVPVTAIWFQSIIACVILVSSSFDRIITYTTFVLTLFSTLSVLGVIVYRYKNPGLERPYRTFGYPVTPVIFIVANLWFMAFILKDKQTESLIGLGVVAAGLLVYLLLNAFTGKPVNGKQQ